jgi:hypothetical protein
MKTRIQSPMPSFSTYVEELQNDWSEFPDEFEALYGNPCKLSQKEFRQAKLNYAKEQKDYFHILKPHPSPSIGHSMAMISVDAKAAAMPFEDDYG